MHLQTPLKRRGFFVGFRKNVRNLSNFPYFISENISLIILLMGKYRFVIAHNVSGFIDSNKSIEEMIDICLEAGFYGFEGYLEGIFDTTEKELVRYGEMIKRAGLSIDTFHLPYKKPLLDDIAALYETDRRRNVDKFKSWIEKSVALGSTVGILHPGGRGYSCDVEGMETLCSQSDKSIQELLKFGEQFGYKLALENMPPFIEGKLGSRNEHMTRLFEKNRHPNLGFCLDTGHSLMSYGENAISTFETMKDNLLAFHLADNGGDRDSHLQPGKGNYCWDKFFKALDKINFTGNICVETPPFAIGPNYSKEAWIKMFAELNELAEKSLK